MPGCGVPPLGVETLDRRGGRRRSGHAGVVGVGVGGAVGERDLRAHVIERLAEHSGDVNLHLAAIGRRRGDLPGVEAVACGGAELDGHLAGSGQIEGIERDLRIIGCAGAGDACGKNDGDHGGGVVLRGRRGEGDRDRDVLTEGQDDGSGEFAGRVDGAGGGSAPDDSVDEPFELAAAAGGGGELKLLSGGEGDVLGRDGDGAALAGGGRSAGGRLAGIQAAEEVGGAATGEEKPRMRDRGFRRVGWQRGGGTRAWSRRSRWCGVEQVPGEERMGTLAGDQGKEFGGGRSTPPFVLMRLSAMRVPDSLW